MDIQKDIFKKKILSYFFDSPSLIVCNSKSLMSFNSLQSQLLFDVLCLKMDQIVMELSAKTLT